MHEIWEIVFEFNLILLHVANINLDVTAIHTIYYE